MVLMTVSCVSIVLYSISDACSTAVHDTSRIKKRVDGIEGYFLIQVLVAERNCSELFAAELESDKKWIGEENGFSCSFLE